MVVMVSEYTAVRSNNCSKRSKMAVILQQDLIEQYGNHKVVLLRNDTQDISKNKTNAEFPCFHVFPCVFPYN